MLTLRSDVRVERLGDEYVALDAQGEVVHRLSGTAVEVVHLLQNGVELPDVPERLAASLDELIDAGVVDDGRGLTRRRLLATGAGGGAVWAGATVVTFALADPAAATTMCSSGWVADGSMDYSDTSMTHTFMTGPAGPGMTMYNLTVHAWGGGGGGGGGSVDSTGGGGGGGQYRGGSIEVTECTSYTITVGAGGGWRWHVGRYGW